MNFKRTNHHRPALTAAAAAMLCACAGTTPNQGEPELVMKKATLIPFTAHPSHVDAVDSLLRSGRDLVEQNEPGTQHWYALRQENASEGFAIFDIFKDASAMDAHFAGDVAAALQKSAATAVQNGWKEGVVANVQTYDVIAQHRSPGTAASLATAIQLRAAPGQADALAALLVQGAKIIASTEPGTPFWFALRSSNDPETFAIFDLFISEDARQAHFSGKVAKALKDQADQLVAGGWEQGVVANVRHFQTRAILNR
ncbi:MAG: antibiotic biosynthesis monooxygenase [Myxococcota bacterium]